MPLIRSESRVSALCEWSALPSKHPEYYSRRLVCVWSSKYRQTTSSIRPLIWVFLSQECSTQRHTHQPTRAQSRPPYIDNKMLHANMSAADRLEGQTSVSVMGCGRPLRFCLPGMTASQYLRWSRGRVTHPSRVMTHFSSIIVHQRRVISVKQECVLERV